MPGTRRSAGAARRRLWLAGLSAAVMFAGACHKGKRLADARLEGEGNLLLITLDTTRADRIGAYGDSRAGTPNLDRLAREGVRFDRAYTSVPLTLPAHATLMTGREPPAHQVRNNGTYTLPPEENTLAEMLQAAGFSTQAVIAAYVLQGKFGLDQGFDDYDDGLGVQPRGASMRSEIPADRVYAKFARWLDRSPASPFFCWVHLYDPHAPYQPPAAFRARFPDDPYRGEIAFMDEAIGRMLQELERRKLLDSTLVIVAGDHGEGFGEHGESEHGVFCYEETLRVPLIFRQPRLFPAARVVSEPVGLVDLLPTVLELYRLPPRAGVQGNSFAGLLTSGKDPGRAQAPRYFESMYGLEEMGWAPLAGLLRGSSKYISLPRPELYDLAADPLELDNIFLKKNALARPLALELDERLRQITRAGAAAPRTRPTRQDQAHLRALGYLASSAADARPGNGEDPKDGIHQLNQLRQVVSALQTKDSARAARLLADLRAAGVDRKLPQFYDLAYEQLRAGNEVAAAERLLAEAISRFPGTTRFPLLLAELYHSRGLEDKAGEMASRVLAMDPLATEAHLLLGGISRQRGLVAQAIGHFRRAAELEPRNAELAVDLAGLLAENGEPAQALDILRTLLKTGYSKGEPGEGEILGQAANWLVKLGQPQLAEELLRELLREQGDNPAHWTQLGLAQLDRGQADQAVHSFRQALQLDPGQALALSGLGTLHLTLFRQNKNRMNLDRASEFFERARQVNPRLVTAANGLGVIHLYRGEVPRAIERLQEAIRLDPAFVNAYFNLAIARMSIGERAEARRILGTLERKFSGRLSAAERDQLDSLRREAGI